MEVRRMTKLAAATDATPEELVQAMARQGSTGGADRMAAQPKADTQRSQEGEGAGADAGQQGGLASLVLPILERASRSDSLGWLRKPLPAHVRQGVRRAVERAGKLKGPRRQPGQ